MIRIAICDDELYVVSQIEEMIIQLQNKYNIDIYVDAFYDGQTLCDYVMKNHAYDLVFLDIEMRALNGLQAAKLIKEKSSNTVLIFISNYDNYLRKLFEVESFRFLDKPIDWKKFEKYFLDAYKKINCYNYFEFKFKKEIIKLPLDEIIYFESDNRLIYVWTNREKYKFYGKLNEIEKTIKEANKSFLRIHQSYLVNYNSIKIIKYHSVVLHNGVELQISEDRQKAIRKSLMDKMVE